MSILEALYPRVEALMALQGEREVGVDAPRSSTSLPLGMSR
jgi:hypothetical protein